MDKRMSEILHRVWRHSEYLKMYMSRPHLARDLDLLIEDYKRLDAEVTKTAEYKLQDLH